MILLVNNDSHASKLFRIVSTLAPEPLDHCSLLDQNKSYKVQLPKLCITMPCRVM